MPKQNGGSGLDAATIDASQAFVVDGDKLCIESTEVERQLFYIFV